jgi:hypothetical protein
MARVLAKPRPAYTGTIAEGAGVRKVLEALELARGGSMELLGGSQADPEFRAAAVGAPDADTAEAQEDEGK